MAIIPLGALMESNLRRKRCGTLVMWDRIFIAANLGQYGYWRRAADSDGMDAGATFPNMPFNQEVSFPCELTLHSTPNGLRIFREPIKEIVLLHTGQDAWTNRTVKANEVLPLEPGGRLFHIMAKLSIAEGARLTFNILGVPVILTSKQWKMAVGRQPSRGAWIPSRF